MDSDKWKCEEAHFSFSLLMGKQTQFDVITIGSIEIVRACLFLDIT